MLLPVGVFTALKPHPEAINNNNKKSAKQGELHRKPSCAEERESGLEGEGEIDHHQHPKGILQYAGIAPGSCDICRNTIRFLSASYAISATAIRRNRVTVRIYRTLSARIAAGHMESLAWHCIPETSTNCWIKPLLHSAMNFMYAKSEPVARFAAMSSSGQFRW